jgi:hypothetical protein
LRAVNGARHHGVMFSRRAQLLTRAEMNGLILLIMSIDEQLRRLVRIVEDENGEAAEE